jgi:HEAT repeat protein
MQSRQWATMSSLRTTPGIRGIAVLTVALILGSQTSTVRGDDGLEAEVRRLWVQASDGAVRHRDLVTPSKDSLIAMADSAIPYLLSYLETEDARERHTITDLFKGIGPAAVSQLTGVLGTGSDYHTRNTLWALQKIGDSAATPAMVPFLLDTMWTIRDQAATSIGACGGSDAQPALYSSLRDEQRRVRKSVVVGLGRLNQASASDSLVAAMTDGWFAVRYTAAIALVALDSGTVAAELTGQLSPEPLAMVLRAFAASPSEPALELGLRYAWHDDYRVRAAAVFVLQQHATSLDQLDPLKGLILSETHPLVKAQLQQCTERLSQ